MKKIILGILISITLSAFTFAVPSDANNRNEKNWSSISYETIPIHKVLDSKDAYIIIYAKHKVGVGQTVIPKKWAKFTPGESRKLTLRKLPNGKLKSFMTVVKKEGNFHKVILTIPMDKKNSVWGVADYRKQIEGTDKETLEELEM